MTEESQTQLNRMAPEIEALYEIGKVLTSELNLEKILKLILQRGRRMNIL